MIISMADVIIVPGRGIEMDGTLPPDAVSRVKKAVELYRDGRAPRIIMSGAYSMHLKERPVSTEAHAMKQNAVQLGVSENNIIEEDTSTHTIGNAYFTKQLFCKPNEWRDIIVVASDDHMPRVKFLFAKLFGPTYHLEFVESDRVISDDEYAKELEHEKNSMARAQKGLGGITDGDDEAVRAMFATNLPDDPIAKY